MLVEVFDVVAYGPSSSSASMRMLDSALLGGVGYAGTSLAPDIASPLPPPHVAGSERQARSAESCQTGPFGGAHMTGVAVAVAVEAAAARLAARPC